MDQTYMKEKKILPLVLSMSYPMMLSMAVGALYNIIDSFFVAQLDMKAMTALSLLYPVQNLAQAVAVGFAIGINAVVSYSFGAGKLRRAHEAATTGFLLSIFHGIMLGAVYMKVMPLFLAMFTSDGAIIQYGTEYSDVVFLFSVFNFSGIAFEKIFQAVGRMKSSMFCMIVGCVTNIILDPLLIFGVGPFPTLGIRGAALATGLGQLVMLVVYMVLYGCTPVSIQIKREFLKLEKDNMKRLYSIGGAATLNMALPSLQVSALNAILSGFSDNYVFILGVYYKLQTFLYLSANGIVQGIRPLIGYNYGAGEYKRVKKIYHISMVLIGGIMVIGTILCLYFPQQLIGLFTNEASIISMGALALQLISIGFVVSTVSVVTSGALEGLGKGAPSLVISLMRYIVLILPLAFVFSRYLGANGVWHAFWLTEFFAAALSVVVYRRAIHDGCKKMTV